MRKELELYEILFLLHPNFTEKEIADKIQVYQDFLTAKGSKVMVQNQGRRSLSYPIQKFEAANFIQMVFLGNGQLIKSFKPLNKVNFGLYFKSFLIFFKSA